jgi:bifunctional DNA-binding transcriptional regulator/antitoxin component of YhaV-PrlF toxin-antitoxin module
MREETTVVEMDARGRVQIPLPLRKALGLESGALVRITVSKVVPEDVDMSSSEKNPREAVTAA